MSLYIISTEITKFRHPTNFYIHSVQGGGLLQCTRPRAAINKWLIKSKGHVNLKTTKKKKPQTFNGVRVLVTDSTITFQQRFSNYFSHVKELFLLQLSLYGMVKSHCFQMRGLISYIYYRSTATYKRDSKHTYILIYIQLLENRQNALQTLFPSRLSQKKSFFSKGATPTGRHGDWRRH